MVDDNQLGGPALTAVAADYGHLYLLGPADPGWFSAPSQMPGALIEPLFIIDPFEVCLAASPSRQELIAGGGGLAQAVEQFFVPASPQAGANSEAGRQAHPHAKGRSRSGDPSDVGVRELA